MGLIVMLVAPALDGSTSLGFDTGATAPAVVARLSPPDVLLGHPGLWLRIRGVADPGRDSPIAVAREQGALASLRARGFRICVLLTRPASAWTGGVRAEQGSRLPLDLREAEAAMRRLALGYRGLVDLWEIDNEPDIGFLPENAETYLAFFKACYWGAGPRVLMGALALPPGPYFERMAEDDLLAYTAGLNYHFYGYAEDFTGVYRQFQAAVDEAGRRRAEGARHPPQQRALPVYLTEFGYGMLGAHAAATAEGRSRQLHWFESVASQLREVPVAGAMAFLLPPFLERGLNEFGLSISPPASSSQRPDPAHGDAAEASRAPEHRLIGGPVLGAQATPALAFLLQAAAGSGVGLPDRMIAVADPTPVVIDLVAGAGLRPAKSAQGYYLSPETPPGAAGEGELRIYNFSGHQIAGILRSVLGDDPPVDERIAIPPGGMRIRPVHLAVPTARTEGERWRVSFLSDASPGVSRFSTRLIPAGAPDTRTDGLDLGVSPEASARHRAMLLGRRLAAEEPRLHPDGRWLVTEGLAVREEAGRWEFELRGLPSDALRPAVAELPLADDPGADPGGGVALAWRCLAAGPAASRYEGLSSERGGLIQVQLRTTNGNLYEVWPRRPAAASWVSYRESLTDYTPSFFGRAQPPWKLERGRLASLVLTFWPRFLPTDLEFMPPAAAPPAPAPVRSSAP